MLRTRRNAVNLSLANLGVSFGLRETKRHVCHLFKDT
jgi:hypothetical protein